MRLTFSFDKKKAQRVTIVVLFILAGITLNAVIGENGIIFQAKDTKNLVDNETKYDNEQLASLQNELKDNQLYSGIGIIPGTDQGGASEGGENGSSGTNQGGSQGNIGNNQGGGAIGENAQTPNIVVVEGERVAAAFYRSDVTVQIYTQDRTQRIKYILNTDVTEIQKELYPSGLIRELDIENGGTLTFTKDGEYTITAYAYDTQGKKSNPTVLWFKKGTSTTETGITLTPSGSRVEGNEWYTSNVSIRVLAMVPGSSKVTYRVQGTVYEKGNIGGIEYPIGAITPNEVEIANGTTLKIETDGDFTITAFAYDEAGIRITSSEPLIIKRDATRPVIRSFTGRQVFNGEIGQGFEVTADVIDNASGLIATPYTYYDKLATATTYNTPSVTAQSNKMYTNLEQTKTYDMYVLIEDKAGNKVMSDIISKPALWISSNPNQSEGEQVNGGREGSIQYTRSPNVEFSFRGQDSYNVEMAKIEYEVKGTATENGTIDGTSYTKDQPVDQRKSYESTGADKQVQTLNLATDGNWEVNVHTYNKEGTKIVTTNTIKLCRDTVAPTVRTFEVTTTSYTTADAVVTNDSFGVSGQRTGGGYTYYYGTSSQGTKTVANHSYTGMTKTTDFDKELKVETTDKAGNTTGKVAPTNTTYYLKHRAEVGDFVDYGKDIWSGKGADVSIASRVGQVEQGTHAGSSPDANGWVCVSINPVTIATRGSGFTYSINNTINSSNQLSDLSSFIKTELGSSDYYIIANKDFYKGNISRLAYPQAVNKYGGTAGRTTVVNTLCCWEHDDPTTYYECVDYRMWAGFAGPEAPSITLVSRKFTYESTDSGLLKQTKYCSNVGTSLPYSANNNYYPNGLGSQFTINMFSDACEFRLGITLKDSARTSPNKSALYGDSAGWPVI